MSGSVRGVRSNAHSYRNVCQANWQKTGGESPLERRSNQTAFLREPCVGSREGAGEASVAARMGGANEHRKYDDPGCRGFPIGRRQHRRHRFGEMPASPAVSENPYTSVRLLLGPWEIFKLSRRSWRDRVGKEKPEAYDERLEEVGWGRTTWEGGEQGSVSSCGVAGGKGPNQGEFGTPKHAPNAVSGTRASGGGPDTERRTVRPEATGAQDREFWVARNPPPPMAGSAVCRQAPEVGAGWINVHVRICAGGAQ